MSHMRMQILGAFVTALTSLTTTGANVFLARAAPLQRTQVPGLVVESGNETIEPTTLGRPRLQERNFQVNVLVHVRESDDFETELNTIFSEVEVALANSAVAASVGAKWLVLRNIDAPKRLQNEVTYVQAEMNFMVFYIVSELAPDTAL